MRRPGAPARTLSLVIGGALAACAGLTTGAAPAAAEPPDLVLEGTEVTGSASSSRAPEITPEEVWLADSPTGEDVQWYLLPRATTGSTLRVGAALQPGQAYAGVRLSLLTLDDQDSCGTTEAYLSDEQWAGTGLLTLATDSRAGDNPASCLTDDALLLSVSASGTAEDPSSVPMQLVVSEEPAVSGGGDLPGPVEEPVPWRSVPATGEATAAEGAHSLAEAPELEEGLHEGTLTPGETQLFRVDLDWGQSLQAEVRVPRLGEDRGIPTAYALPVRVLVRSPVLAPSTADSVDEEDASVSSTAYIDPADETRVRATTAPVRYRNVDSQVDGVPGASLPGAYYVEVAVPLPQDEDTDPDVEVPFELVVQRSGEAGAGTPSYTDGELRISGVDGGPGPARIGVAAGLGLLGIGSLGASAALLVRRRRA